MTTITSPRLLAVAGFLGCAFLLGSALYLEHVRGLEPCPLCVFQRVAVLAAALGFLVGAVAGGGVTGARIGAVLAGLGAAAGVALAGRHVWLQHLPADEVPECGPGLDYLLDVFPLREVLEMVLTGSGECADVDWTFAGFSLPEWTLFAFACMLAWCVLIFVRAGALRRA